MKTKTAFKKGQVMILAVIALGGTILGATTIAGLLTVYQIRASADAGSSARAVFAADTGLEWGLYQFTHPSSTHAAPTLVNASFTTTCYDASGAALSCQSADLSRIRAVGASGGARRAFDARF